MQSQLEELKETLSEFIRQDQRSVLVIALAENELIYLYKMIEAFDDRDKANVYCLFAQPAGPPGDYADAVVGNLRQQLDAVNEARVAEGNASWPAMPEACRDPYVAPGKRLSAALDYMRGLVPTERGNRVVWALAPSAVTDRVGYAGVVGALLPRDGTPLPTWLRGVRLIIRDDREAPSLVPFLRKERNDQVLIYEPDFSPAAMIDSMAKDVADPATSEPRRMNALAQLAALDYAYGRLPQAAEKFGILYEYYTRHGATEMRAFMLNGVGDILRKLGRLPLAKERYQQGLTLALETKALPLMYTLAVNVGDVSADLKQHADAEGHWQAGLTLAKAMMNLHGQADLLEKIGAVEQLTSRPGDAAAAWTEGASIAEQAKYHAREVTILERLVALFDTARMGPERRAAEVRLRAARGASSGSPS